MKHEKLEENVIRDKISGLNGWQYLDGALEKNVSFTGFRDAIAAMIRIAFECEAMNHHPEWTNVYNRLKIRLNTHDAGGVTDKDFQLAQKMDAIIGT